MGMFDSLMIEIDAEPVELQSKRFDRVLARYQVGDVVSGAPAGVRVFVDRVGLDAQGRRVYREEEMVRRCTVFVVLAHAVFVDYEVVEGEPGATEVLQRLRALQQKWEDSARLLSRLITSLGEKQARIEQLERQIDHGRAAIEDARRIRAGEEVRHRLLPVWDYTKRLEQGEEPLDVLAWVLGEDWPDVFGRGGFPAVEPDPLDEYRL